MGPLVPIVSQYEPHPITKDLAGMMTLFPLTRSIETARCRRKARRAAARQDERAVLGRDGQVRVHQGRRQPGRGREDRAARVALVATIDAQAKPEAKTEGAEPAKPSKARLVVVGTADFASNQFLRAQGNKDFFLNVVSWLAEEEDLLSVRPKDTKQNPIVLTRRNPASCCGCHWPCCPAPS